MTPIKQLSSFMVLSIDGGDRVSFTYSEINPDTGEMISDNKKANFFVLDEELKGYIDSIRTWLRKNKLQ